MSEGVSFLHVLGSQENGHAHLLVDGVHLFPYAGAADGVQTGGGLVEEEYLGPVNEGGGQVEATLHPTGVSADEPVHGISNVHQRRQVGDTTVGLSPGEAVQLGLHSQQFPSSLLRIQRCVLQGNPDMQSRFIGSPQNIHTSHVDGACRRRQQRHKHPYHCRLARPVGTKETVYLAIPYIQVEAVYGSY